MHKHAMASQVTVFTAVTPDEIQLKIHDDGVGFGDNCQEGIGIAGMRDRLKELNGTLEVKSSEHVGSAIIATVPIGKKVISHDPIDYAGLPAAPTARRRILLVDSQDMVRRGVRNLLANEPDLEICGEASNGEEALKLVKGRNPDILDLQLPGQNGWWVLRELKKRRLQH